MVVVAAVIVVKFVLRRKTISIFTALLRLPSEVFPVFFMKAEQLIFSCHVMVGGGSDGSGVG